jgi:hypothetical protein
MMNKYYTQQLINEAVDNVLLEFKKGTSLAKLARKYKDERKQKGESTLAFVKRLIDRFHEEKAEKDRHRKRSRKKKGGGREYYDYDDYLSKETKASVADADDLINSIDQEKTDIAAVARDVFPHHTPEGAQSQLRKILNKERPMTQRVARKLREMLDSGQIATK